MKKIIVTGSSFTVLIALGLVIAGNHFYSEAIKRGQIVELHKETDVVPVSTNNQNKIDEAIQWFDNQEFKIETITSEDGLLLEALFLENEKTTGKTVILAHGFRNDRESMKEFVQFYYNQGFNILLPDSRGHGKSEGDYIGFGWHDRLDYQQWIQVLIDKKNSKHILLHGTSMGAATVLMTSGEKLPQEVKGIIADSGYTSAKDILTYQLKHLYNLPAFPMVPVTSAITNVRAGFTFGEASVLNQVEKNTRPLLIIHGEKDELVPTSMAHHIYEAASGEKELWTVPYAGHIKSYTVATEKYEQRLKDFIAKVIEE
ncbi:alpha/beta hydrolase [Bacillus sp. FJAT-45350]|uniref:alpha/beta hydrolase n=1 Tax=Bacillus sp. FJAT-45350 TaxID=2011014 RepID=UPI00211C6A05|nr:alpha/beta hydrolase [Bacillus sp. FJAT-45350]